MLLKSESVIFSDPQQFYCVLYASSYAIPILSSIDLKFSIVLHEIAI